MFHPVRKRRREKDKRENKEGEKKRGKGKNGKEEEEENARQRIPKGIGGGRRTELRKEERQRQMTLQIGTKG